METRKRTKRAIRHFSAADKSRAVLTLWTERRSLTELCQEMGVSWNVLNQWQEAAMAGLLQALEPKRKVPCGQIPLNTRLQNLLERNVARTQLSSMPAATLSPAKAAETPVRSLMAEAPRLKPEKAG